jgi:hypothetical protein
MEHKPITYLYYESGQYKAIVIHMATWGAIIWGGGKNLCQAHFYVHLLCFMCTVISELHVIRTPKLIVL